jgi:DNA repair protein RadC
LAVFLLAWIAAGHLAEGAVPKRTGVADYLMPLLRDLKYETFKVVLLDRRNSVLDVVDIDEGDVAT